MPHSDESSMNEDPDLRISSPITGMSRFKIAKMTLLSILLWPYAVWLYICSVPRSQDLFELSRIELPVITQLVVQVPSWIVFVAGLVSFFLVLLTQSRWAVWSFLIVLPLIFNIVILIGIYLATVAMIDAHRPRELLELSTILWVMGITNDIRL